ncbi:hypothetical protein ES703_112852 [subsurface metagenome]
MYERNCCKKTWTDEKPTDNANAGSKVDIDIFINGITDQIAKSYESEQIGATYNTCGLSINCQSAFGQRLNITETINGVYITATKSATTTPTLYLEIEGTEV